MDDSKKRDRKEISVAFFYFVGKSGKAALLGVVERVDQNFSRFFAPTTERRRVVEVDSEFAPISADAFFEIGERLLRFF